MLGLNVMGSAFSLVTDSVIGMNANLEKSTLQFETLMGDADKARAHVESLFEFGSKTPFETGPIIEASRIMETFGGSALNTKENLKLFGDTAAATGAGINDIGFWMSRAYADIQAGRPFGEAAARLSELGAITPATRSELEALQKEGADGSKVWDTLAGSLGRFDGAMEKQAGTWEGLTSTLMESIQMLIANGLRPLFEGMKGAITFLNDLMASEAFNGALAAAGQALGVVFGKIGSVFGAVGSAVAPVLEALGHVFDVVASGDDVASGLGETLGNLGEKFGEVGKTIQDAVFGALEKVISGIPGFADAILDMANAAIDVFVAAAPGFVDAIMGMIQNALSWVMDTGVPMAAEALGQVALKFVDWVGPAAERLAAALPPIIGKVLEFLAANLPVIAGKLLEWAGAFVGWIAENVLPRLPGMLAAVGSAILGWIAQTAPIVIGRLGDMALGVLRRVGEILPKLPAMFGRFISEAISKIIGMAPSVVAGAFNMASQFHSTIVGFLAKLPGEFFKFLTKVITSLPGLAADLARGALGAGADFVNGFIKGLGDLPKKLFNAIASAVRGIKVDIGPFHISASGIRIDMPKLDWPQLQLPSFATGAWNLPSDMVAQVHKGEMIVPRDIAERLRGGRAFGGGGAAAGGGGDVQIINITISGDYYGIDRNIDDLGDRLAARVRAGRVKRAYAG